MIRIELSLETTVDYLKRSVILFDFSRVTLPFLVLDFTAGDYLRIECYIGVGLEGYFFTEVNAFSFFSPIGVNATELTSLVSFF